MPCSTYLIESEKRRKRLRMTSASVLHTYTRPDASHARILLNERSNVQNLTGMSCASML